MCDVQNTKQNQEWLEAGNRLNKFSRLFLF
jgi:hypothetical protein